MECHRIGYFWILRRWEILSILINESIFIHFFVTFFSITFEFFFQIWNFHTFFSLNAIFTLPLGLQIRQNNGIYIPYNKQGKASGEAFVHFETIEDCNQALQRNMNKLGHRFVIAIFFLKQQKIKLGF